MHLDLILWRLRHNTGPAGADTAHHRDRRHRGAAASAAVGGASELPDVVCRHACADRGL